MADGRHIENRILAISLRFIVRLTRNLVRCSTIMLRHRSNDQSNNFRKFKMADGRYFENSFIAISQPRIVRFQWIWCAAADFGFKDGHVTKYQNIIN